MFGEDVISYEETIFRVQKLDKMTWETLSNRIPSCKSNQWRKEVLRIIPTTGIGELTINGCFISSSDSG